MTCSPPSRPTQRRAVAWVRVAAAALLLTGCAGAGEGPGDPTAFGGSAREVARPRDAAGAERALNVFLSPSGEPFRGGPGAPYASAAWFARADADHDGRLTAAEFRADAMRTFASYDSDGNGVIDAFELQHYEQAVAPEILPRIDGLRAGEGADDSLFHGAGGGGRGRGAAPRGGGGRREVAGDRSLSGAGLYAMLAEPEPITAADSDVSGTVSRAEWLARTDIRFALLDPTRRGYLILSDLPKPQAQVLLERRRAREAERRKSARPTAQPLSGG